MSLQCSIFGHRYGKTTVEEERKQEGSEVVLISRKSRVCERCGDTLVVSENKEVTTIETVGPTDQTGRQADTHDETGQRAETHDETDRGATPTAGGDTVQATERETTSEDIDRIDSTGETGGTRIPDAEADEHAATVATEEAGVGGAETAGEHGPDTDGEQASRAGADDGSGTDAGAVSGSNTPEVGTASRSATGGSGSAAEESPPTDPSEEDAVILGTENDEGTQAETVGDDTDADSTDTPTDGSAAGTESPKADEREGAANTETRSEDSPTSAGGGSAREDEDAVFIDTGETSAAGETGPEPTPSEGGDTSPTEVLDAAETGTHRDQTGESRESASGGDATESEDSYPALSGSEKGSVTSAADAATESGRGGGGQDDAEILDSDSPLGADDSDWPAEPEATGDDWTPETRPEMQSVDGTSTGPMDRPLTVSGGEFRCPDCDFRTPVAESSHRKGDFCPVCHLGALEHYRPDD